MIDIEAVRNDTTAGLSEQNEDLSHLTEELVQEALDNAVALLPEEVLQEALDKGITALGGVADGNTFMRYGNAWRWRKNCSSNPADWLYWGGQASATRVVNCANGLLHYSIRWW